MKTMDHVARYLRTWLYRLDIDHFRSRLIARGPLLAAAIFFSASVATLLPVRAGIMLAALTGFAAWAAIAPLPEDEEKSRARAVSNGQSNQIAARSDALAIAQSLVGALNDPVLVLDNRLNVVSANTAADDIFGGVRLGAHVSVTTRNPALAAALAESLRTARRATFTLDIRTPLERHLEGVVSPLVEFGDVADRVHLLVHVRDLTEQDRLSAMRADFVANASHELRTPLASLKGFIETLKGPAREDATARERFLDIMSQQAERMTRLIDDLLSLSRIEMRAHIAPSDRVDLNDVAKTVVAALEPQAAIAGATVTVYPSQRSSIVRGDHDEVMQAVQNLVQNAIKYGKPNGRIDVRIDDGSNGAATISVSDDGPGIAPEHLPRLTERFYRVNAASSRDRGGTGLGLAIVKHIATRHRGTLDVSSTLGKGSTFKLTLPTAK